MPDLRAVTLVKWLIAGLAGITIAALILAIVWADRSVVRYQEYACQFEAIHSDSGDADIVVFGNSRTMRAINAKQFESALGRALKTDTPPTVLDLSRSWRGQEHGYAILSEYLSTHSPDLLLIELNRGPGATRRYHPHTPLTVPYRTLLWLAITDDGNGTLYQRLFWTLRAVLERTAKRLGDAIAGRIRDERQMTSPLLMNRDCTAINEEIRLERNARRMQRDADWASEPDSWSLDEVRTGNDLYTRMTREIIELARKRGVRTVLFYVPRLYQSQLSRNFIDDAAVEFNVPFLAPDESMHETLFQPGMFRDPTHLTLAGSGKFADWLAARLVQNDLITNSP